MQVGVAKSGKRSSTKIVETMVNDYLLKEKWLEHRHHELYQPRECELLGYVDADGRQLCPDGYGPGGRDTGVRMLGAPSRRRLHNVDTDDIKEVLARQLRYAAQNPTNTTWPRQVLQGWNDQAVMQCIMELHSYASVSYDKERKLDAAVKRSGDIDNSWFSVSMPRSAEDKSELPLPPTEIPYEELTSTVEIPRDLEKMKFDYDNQTIFCQVSSSR